MSGWHGGKGDKYRSVNRKKFSENWDKIFKPKDTKKEDLEKGIKNPN